jgi:translation initiation factor IF-1
MADNDNVELQGTVIDFSRDLFKVEVVMGDAAHIVMCKPSGKMRMNSIKIVPGDLVQIKVSPHDLTKGRIVYRSK